MTVKTLSFSPLTLSESERTLLSALFRQGPLPRSDLSDLTPLSQQSVHRLLEKLAEQGLVRFGDPQIRGRGKPSPTVWLDPSRYASLGVSITTERVGLCILDLAGQRLCELVIDANPGAPESVMDKLERQLESWKPDLLSSRTLIGMGVGMQGWRSGRSDCFQPPEPLNLWRGLPLTETFGKRFGLACFAENNSTASAIAEHYVSSGDSFQSLIYLSFDYGFGGGIFVDGHALVGERGNAGELSTLFGPEEARSRPALEELLKRLRDKGMIFNTVSDMVARFDPAWPGVDDWVREVAPQLRLMIQALKAIVDPGAICFGGEAPSALRQALLRSCEGATDGHGTPNPVLRESRISGDAAHMGAAFLPLHAMVFAGL
jgi:predicted NBD/HSP70 family sugar kinase